METGQGINILIAVNRNYLKICKTMLFSLFTHNENCNIHIYILNSNLNWMELKDLSLFIEKFSGILHIITVPEDTFQNMPLVIERFSIEMYYRIIAYMLLPENVERILWLDADIVVLNNLKDLYFQNFEDKSLIVCKDFGYKTTEITEIKNKMDIAEDHDYFNSGMILFNLKLIRICFDENKLKKCMVTYAEKLFYPDQDLLNHLYQGKVKYVDELYNFQVNNTYKIDVHKLGIRILHYTGNKKPWAVKRALPSSKYYWNTRLKMKDYSSYFIFYILYYVLWVPKFIKRCIHPEC